jgi:hypothetical protein
MGDGKLPDGVSAFFWLEHLLPRFKQLIVVRHKSGGTKWLRDKFALAVIEVWAVNE